MKKVFTVLFIAIVFCVFQVIFFLMMNESTTEAAPQDNFQEQIDALSTEIERMKIQLQDLYFMTEPLRVSVVDGLEGSFYYSYASGEIRGMLPSELQQAELYYLLRSAGDLGYSEAKIKELSNIFLSMGKNPYFRRYEPEYNFGMGEVTYHPDLKGYVENRLLDKK